MNDTSPVAPVRGSDHNPPPHFQDAGGDDVESLTLCLMDYFNAPGAAKEEEQRREKQQDGGLATGMWNGPQTPHSEELNSYWLLVLTSHPRNAGPGPSRLFHGSAFTHQVRTFVFSISFSEQLGDKQELTVVTQH